MSPLILFIDGFPASFTLHHEGEKYIIIPFENPYERDLPSKIEVLKSGSEWIIKGTDDADLIEQLKEDLSLSSECHL